MFSSPIARVGVNSFWLFLSRLASQVLAMLATIMIARFLGQAGFGQYAFFSAIIFTANIFTTFGTDTLLIREIASRHDVSTPLLASSLWVQILLSALCITAIFLFSPHLVIGVPDSVLPLQIFSLSLIPLAFFSVYSALLRAYERMDLILLVNLWTTAGLAAGFWITLGHGGNLLSLVSVNLAVQIMAASMAAWLCHRHLPVFKLYQRVDFSMLNRVVRLGWPLALLAGLAVIYQRMGVFILSYQAGASATGWYSAAARIVEAFKFVHLAFFGALFPILARIASSNNYSENRIGQHQSVTHPWRKWFLRLVLFSLVASTGLTLLAAPVIHLLYGSGFLPSITALQILAWSLIPYTFSARFSLEMVTRRQENHVVIITVLSLACSALLNLALIPRFGVPGASLATVACEVAQALALAILSSTILVKAREKPHTKVMMEATLNERKG